MLKPRHRLPGWIVAGFLLAVLGGSVAARWLPRREVVMTLKQSLALHLPAEILGWNVSDELLAATEWQANLVQHALRFDDFVYRTYSRPGLSFSIYVAYWAPGKPARGLVGGHTPDTCWPLVGCQMLERRSEMKLVAGEHKLLDGEWRRFRMSGGTTTEVVWWHIVGGQVLHFDQWSLWRWLRDAVHELRVAGCEQYFVRITTAQPMSDVLTDPAFQAIIARFPLGGVLGREDRDL